MAARMHFGIAAELARVDSTAAAIEEVARSRVDFAVVPYESLKDEPIFPTIAAIAGADLKLIGEREQTQALSLVNKSGNPADVRKVYASPLDHAACATYLEAHHGDLFVHDVKSPIVVRGLRRGGRRLRRHRPARLHIGEARSSRRARTSATRARSASATASSDASPAPRSGADATALLFSVHDRPGALHAILVHFKERNCNLRRIQSRPVPGEGWEYLFYIEVSGHMTDRSLVAAVEGVKRETKTLKILGSFLLEFPEPSPMSIR